MNKLFARLLFGSICFMGLSGLYGQEALNNGVFSIAGSIDYSASSYKDNYSSYNSHNFNLAPQFVYFIANHTSIGITIDYINNFEGSTESSFSIGPSFRYYFYVEEFIPFLELTVTLGDPYLEGSSGFNAGIGIRGGFEYFLSGSVALEPSISYNHSSFSPSGSNSTSTITNVFEVGIGVNYFIF
jgi:hypothetical protein